VGRVGSLLFREHPVEPLFEHFWRSGSDRSAVRGSRDFHCTGDSVVPKQSKGPVNHYSERESPWVKPELLRIII
jgi:hypothetical protein